MKEACIFATCISCMRAFLLNEVHMFLDPWHQEKITEHNFMKRTCLEGISAHPCMKLLLVQLVYATKVMLISV